MVRVDQLLKLSPEAWTALLGQEPDLQGTVVTAVEAEHLRSDASLTRFWLTLAGYSERTTLLGKQTNGVEARFFQDVAPQLPFLAPRCWFSHIAADQSWIVLDDVQNDWSIDRWTAGHLEGIIEQIASLHATFWGEEPYLEHFGWRWLPDRKSSKIRDVADSNEERSLETANPQLRQPSPRIGDWERASQAPLSDHARRSSGRMAPTLMRAADGLKKVIEVGGWPGVLEAQHLMAMADLIDDPVPMLYPLRQLPFTLLHGNLSAYHWRLTLFDQYRLLEWQNVAIGPGVYDLVTFIEQFGLLKRKRGGWIDGRPWPVSEETMEDSYILAMGNQLTSRFDATMTRQALPAARCLYVITTWLPRFAEWFQSGPGDRQLWAEVNSLSNDQIAEAGFTQTANLRSYLVRLFDRFLDAYKSL